MFSLLYLKAASVSLDLKLLSAQTRNIKDNQYEGGGWQTTEGGKQSQSPPRGIF